MQTERDHFTNPPPRRLGALGIIRNPAGAVLMTEKTRDALRGEERRPWFHPGGCVEENEPLLDGLVRSVTAKLGITVQPGRLLAVHHMYHQQHPTHLSVEGVNFLFDCGVIDEGTPFRFSGSINGARWMLPDELDEQLTPFTAARTHAALRALHGGDVEVLAGHPA
ncbi:NUDIX domain-containing protein [Streptomyces sp. LUP47B]|uniref:NUDIX domain-containing protein n=1 Tax=Streptomyces sp. LUP47B TaxID=1890286 RepID=UPI0008520CE4|nr:NUDIX hydrolase [Streptomyces sp. LUP47B]